MHAIDPAATAWLLASTALVLLMTPGLAIFYGGMVRTTGVLNMIMMSFISIPLVTVAWLLVGYTPGLLRGRRRRPDRRPRALSGWLGIDPDTVARARFPNCCSPPSSSASRSSPPRWSAARSPTARGSRPGWCSSRSGRSRSTRWSRTGCGPRAAGCSSSACWTTRAAWSSRSSPARRRWRWPWCSARASASRRTRCVRTTCRSCCSASACCGSAGSGSTPVRRWPPTGRRRRSSSTRWWPAASACWAGSRVERIRDGRPTTFGAASGVVAGLVAITPSCGTVNTLGAVVVGLAAGVVCSFAVGLKFRFGYDDSLDVVGVHFVGGVVGVLLIGLLATEVMTGGPEGLFYGGGLAQLGKQALAAVVVGRLRLRRVLRDRQGDRPGHGLPGQRRGRDDRRRLHPARRDRVRRGRARPSAGASPGSGVAGEPSMRRGVEELSEDPRPAPVEDHCKIPSNRRARYGR